MKLRIMFSRGYSDRNGTLAGKEHYTVDVELNEKDFAGNLKEVFNNNRVRELEVIGGEWKEG